LSSAKAIFLDRDGILNRERKDYVKSPEELEMLPGIEEPLRSIREKGFQIIVVTNQSAVGRGLTTSELLENIHAKMRTELESRGCVLDAIYYCPHTPEAKCSCRKPQPGLIEAAARERGIDLSKSWFVGDKESDMEAAKRAGCRGIKVPTNNHGLAIAVRRIIATENHTERWRPESRRSVQELHSG
jgi:histidinol-phosphate phosphatase family protein